MRVFLTGFMGCGKSTVGPELARRLGVPFVDLDEEIAGRVGRSIAAIFEQDGETGFRRRERDALLATGESAAAVVATGGGCP
ncbi:MAG: shikimate kinase, partial [Thermoanaerobaculia bacterium]